MSTTKTPTEIDNIKQLYLNKAIQDNKDLFWESVSKEFGVKKSSVRVGWFYRFEIPEKYNVQDNLIAYMQNFIKIKS